MKPMRIEGPRSTSDVKKSDKARKSGGTGGAFSAFMDEGGAETATQTRGAAPMGGIGNLLAVQGADDPTEGKKRKKMMERADKVLTALDGVHRGLVNGDLSTVQMDEVGRAVRENREKINDPRLLAILDEVDLRAQVELAKLEMARDKAKS